MRQRLAGPRTPPGPALQWGGPARGGPEADITLSAAGRPIPIATIQLREDSLGRRQEGAPCLWGLAGLGRQQVHSALEESGLARFEAKTVRFQSRCSGEPPGRVLYEAIALGYSQNREPMLSLARRLPLAELEGYLFDKSPPQAREAARALLLGLAGLLPSQCGRAGGLSAEDWEATELRWRELCARPDTSGLPQGAWRLSQVRPGNHPQARLLALAELVVRHLERGLAAGLLACCGPPPKELPARLERQFLLGAGPSVLPLEGLRADPPAGLGPGRARTIVIDVLLPFSPPGAPFDEFRTAPFVRGGS